MSKKIKVTISPVGSPNVEAEGFVGGACKDATKPITDALGGSKAGNEDVTDKPELHIFGDEDQDNVLSI